MAISAAVEISRPPDVVYGYVTDPSRFPEWQSGVVSGHMESTGAPAVGDRCVTTRRVGWSARPVTAEVSHADPPRTWGVRGVDGPVRAAVSVRVDPVEGSRGALVTIDIDFVGHGLGQLLVPLLVRPQARREMPRNMRRLKERLESDRAD